MSTNDPPSDRRSPLPNVFTNGNKVAPERPRSNCSDRTGITYISTVGTSQMIIDENSVPQIDEINPDVKDSIPGNQEELGDTTVENPMVKPAHEEEKYNEIPATKDQPHIHFLNPIETQEPISVSVSVSSRDTSKEIHRDLLWGKKLRSPSRYEYITTQIKNQLLDFFQPTDNKLSMKLFGNHQALLRERKRQTDMARWIVHPCSKFRFYWDLAMLIILILNMIILPVAISFFTDDLSAHWIAFNSMSDTIFIVDIFINFRTGVIADNFADEIILEPKKIAKHYLRSWFCVDLLSSLPMDYIILIFSPGTDRHYVQAGRALRIIRMLKLLSLLRLLRLSRLVRYVNQWEEFFSFAGMFIRIFNLICLILLLGHWNGCLQFLVPMLLDFPPDTWVSLNELQRAHWSEQYIRALFKALSHMLCIGYGRYPPYGNTDISLTIISMLVGATCYALFVGHATTLIQSFDYAKRLYGEKLQTVEEYMAYRKLPREMRRKIVEYYDHRFQGRMFNEDIILNDLNKCLREEIVNFNCRSLISKVPFFMNADPLFVSDIVSKLNYQVFQPEDYIIRAGGIGTNVYFIQEGKVNVITKDGELFTSLSDGSYFGEICLLTDAKRVASVRAETYCNVFSLHRDHFHGVLKQYPEMARTMENVANERLRKIKLIDTQRSDGNVSSEFLGNNKPADSQGTSQSATQSTCDQENCIEIKVETF